MLTNRLTYERTKGQRPIFFLQPALTDDIVTQHFVYSLKGRDKHLFRLRKSSLDGAQVRILIRKPFFEITILMKSQESLCLCSALQELFYRQPVSIVNTDVDEVVHHVRIIGKPVNSTSDHQRSLDMKIKFLVLNSQT